MNKILVLLCFVTFSAFGQNIRDYYVTNAQADGMLYFIYPLSLFEQAGNGDLTIDITYKTKKDSATVNFSYCQKEVVAADSPFRIQIYSQGKVLTYHPKRAGWTKNSRIIHTILDMAAMQ